MSLSLDLKYRPRAFEDVVGNKKVVKLLENYLGSKKLPKVLILTGPTGCGKTTLAYIIAKTLACDETEGMFICSSCPSCKAIDSVLYSGGRGVSSLGVYTFDMGERRDEEYLQEVAETIRASTLMNKKKVILIDELQRTHTKSQDTLLVPLEYVPEGTHVIITTSNLHGIADAIQSRSTILRCTYPSHEEMLDRAKDIVKEEGIRITREDIVNLCKINDNNPRKVINALGTMKVSAEAGLQYMQEDMEKNEKYLEYFKVIKQGALALIDFIESLSNKAIFLQGIKYFIKDAIKMRLRVVSGIKKEYREQVLSVLSPYTDSDLYQLLEDLIKIDYINDNDAEVHLMVLAFNLNKLMKIEVNKEEDITVRKEIRDKEDESEIKISKITKEILAVESGKVSISDI